MKPIVFYDATAPVDIALGRGAYVLPVNHPSDRVSNKSMAYTSDVVSYNKETGVFETRNTLYKPLTSKSQIKRVRAQGKKK